MASPVFLTLSFPLKGTKNSCYCVQVGRSMCSGHAADASLCGRGVRALHGGLPQTNLPEQVSLTRMLSHAMA